MYIATNTIRKELAHLKVMLAVKRFWQIHVYRSNGVSFVYIFYHNSTSTKLRSTKSNMAIFIVIFFLKPFCCVINMLCRLIKFISELYNIFVFQRLDNTLNLSMLSAYSLWHLIYPPFCIVVSLLLVLTDLEMLEIHRLNMWHKGCTIKSNTWSPISCMLYFSRFGLGSSDASANLQVWYRLH